MTTFAAIFSTIKADPDNQKYTAKGIDPLYMVNINARIVIIGQAPGRVAAREKIVWCDQSGQRLRAWLGIDEKTFYESGKIAVLPMDFYYPGKGKHGDLPPRKDFALKWHQQLLALMPKVELIILVGSYAQRYYLNLPSKQTLTMTVRNYQDYLPQYWPIVHPSPLNLRWLHKNKWFEAEVIPDLQQTVRQILRI